MGRRRCLTRWSWSTSSRAKENAPKKEKKIGGGSCPPGKCFFLGGGKCPNLGVVNVLLANDSQSCGHGVPPSTLKSEWMSRATGVKVPCKLNAALRNPKDQRQMPRTSTFGQHWPLKLKSATRHVM